MKKLLYLTLSILLIVNKLGYSQNNKSPNTQTPKPVSTGRMIGPQLPGQQPKTNNTDGKQQPPKKVEAPPIVSDQESVDYHEEDSSTYTVRRKVSNISKGYRIQIYSGPDRDEAKSVKIDFMKRFPSIRSYITYGAPHYRIRVGDFRNRGEAAEFYRYLSKTYTVMIVPSLINNRIPPKPASASENEEDEEAIKNSTDTAQ